MDIFETIVAIPAITVLCTVAAEAYKLIPKADTKHIPVLCGLIGCGIGVAAFIGVPGYLPADNVIVAASIGAVSGWAATGINQVFKQYGGQ